MVDVAPSERPTDVSPLGVGPWRPNDDSLVAAIVQDNSDGRVLMLAWMDDEAVRRTLDTGWATFWSRSRREYWVKGATSGNRQRVHRIEVDCDGDALLVMVTPEGPACHTGLASCFDTEGVGVSGGGR